MVTVKSKDNSRAKHNAISGCLSDYYGFRLIWNGSVLSGERWLLPRVWQHSALSAVSWRSDLRGATNTGQLWRQNFCSHWTLGVELSSGSAEQSRHHLRTVQTTAEGTSKIFIGSMNMALCDFWYVAP